MRDQDKSKAQLIQELQDLRQRMAQLENTNSSQQPAAGQALAEEHDLLNMVFDHLPAQVYVKDRQSRFILANQATLDNLEIATLEECLGKTDIEMFAHAPQLAAQYFEEEQAIMQSGTPILRKEMPGRDKSGKVLWSIQSKLPLRDDSGEIIGLVGIGIDITARKQAEQALAEERNLLNTVLDHLPAQVYVKDLASRFILANNATIKALYVNTREECLGQTDLELLSHIPKKAAKHFAEEQTLMQTGEPLLKKEDCGIAPTGELEYTETSKLPLRDTSGAIIGLVGIGMDITARKQAEQALAEERNLLNTVLDHLPDQVYVKDLESRFMLTNAATRAILGVSKSEDCIGKTDLELFEHSPKVADQYFAEEQAVMQSGKPLLHKEHAFVSRDDSLVWIETSKLPLRDTAGNIIGLVGIGADITARKLAQNALAEERNLLMTVLNYLPAQVYVKDLQSRFILANTETMKGLHATKPEDYLGKTDLDLIPQAPEKAAVYFAEEQALLQTGEPVLQKEHTSITREGETLWTVTSKMPMRDTAGNITGLVGISIDITARKHGEEAYRNLVDYSLQGLVIFQNDRIVFCNAQYAVMQGFTAEELFAMSTKQLFSNIQPEDRGKALHYAKILNNERIPQNYEVRIIRKDGELRWYESYHVPVYYRGQPATQSMFIDITERKQAEQDLQESEARYRALAEASLEGIVITQEGTLIDANNRYVELSGYSLDEAIGKPVSFFVHPDDHEKVYKKVNTGSEQPYEHRMIRKDGSIITLEAQGRSFIYRGSPVRIAVLRDITDRKQAEAERLALALEQERVTILANFIRDVSHEFRTPLTVLNTSLYLLEHSTDSQKRANQIQVLGDHLQYIENLVEDMLTMSNLDAGLELVFTPVSINSLLLEIDKRIQESAQAQQLTLNFMLAKELPTVQGSQQALYRMLFNLITNAMQYTPPDGSVTVHTTGNSNQVVIEVIDTGQGIADDDLPHVFERFYRSDQARTERRAGLGLSIAQKVAEIHHGSITIESEIGSGSTFRVVLPVNPPPAHDHAVPKRIKSGH